MSMHTFSNGTLGQSLSVEFHNDNLHVRAGMKLLVVATKEEARRFIYELLEWANDGDTDLCDSKQPCPGCQLTHEESQEQNTAEVKRQTVEPLTDEQAAKVARLVVVLEKLVTELATGPDLPLHAYIEVLDSANQEQLLQVASKLQAQLPPPVREIFAALNKL